jgi:hypothetical protein
LILESKELTKALGVYSGLVPPDPIPNSAVKQACGENIAGEALCEDSTTPIYKASGEQSTGAFPFFSAYNILKVLEFDLRAWEL